jgi:hypothetical protein
VHRKRSLWERLKKYLEMPHLKRRDRNQRVAIVGVMVGLVVYLLVLRPIIDIMFPDTRPKQAQSGPTPGSTAIANKKR